MDARITVGSNLFLFGVIKSTPEEKLRSELALVAGIPM